MYTRNDLQKPYLHLKSTKIDLRRTTTHGQPQNKFMEIIENVDKTLYPKCIYLRVMGKRIRTWRKPEYCYRHHSLSLLCCQISSGTRCSEQSVAASVACTNLFRSTPSAKYSTDEHLDVSGQQILPSSVHMIAHGLK